jgi:methylenetetrahydrofolate dehydrogenase (NADP+)/methenyltetrahydrofolate cyclohydrolase
LEALWDTHRVVPQLAIVRVGRERSSVAYERAIHRSGETVGISVSSVHLPDDTTAIRLAAVIGELNRALETHGVIVLQPLPSHLSRFSVADVLAPEKDIDGITTYNAGRLFHDDRDVLAPSTPAGGMALLKFYDVALDGKSAVVLGRSSVVGKPMALMLLAENATVTICHSRTPDISNVSRSADILVSAVGRAGLVTGDMVKPGAVVVDFGVNFVDGRMTGDVDERSVRAVAGCLTPVPGGTGRVTTMVLVRNAIKAATQQLSARAT